MSCLFPRVVAVCCGEWAFPYVCGEVDIYARCNASRVVYEVTLGKCEEANHKDRIRKRSCRVRKDSTWIAEVGMWSMRVHASVPELS